MLPQFKPPLVTAALKEPKMQVYFSWQLQPVLGNLKLLFRVSTPKFQSTGMSAEKKDKMSCAGSTGGGFITERTRCSVQHSHTNSSELSLLLPAKKKKNKIETPGAWTGKGLCKYQSVLVFKVSFVTEFQNKWSHRTITTLCLGSAGSGSCFPSHPFLRWNENLGGFLISLDYYSIYYRVKKKKKSQNRKFFVNQDLAVHINNYPASTAITVQIEQLPNIHLNLWNSSLTPGMDLAHVEWRQPQLI